MRLLELVPGTDTKPQTIDALANFCGGVLGKGVVYANDTVNFIGNRIGCYLMLVGMHRALESGLSSERIDALLSIPVGLPATGLFGLIDLIGLDVMDLVGKNLAVNLPIGDLGVEFATLPGAMYKMLEAGQIGRKSGGGFYRVIKHDDGSRTTETFDLATGDWRATKPVALNAAHSKLDVVLGDDTEARFCWHVIGATLAYAADLIPEIAGDVVNVDRAMRWGYGWARGPFEMLDALGPEKILAKLEADGLHVPRMLQILRKARTKSFYRNNGAGYLGLDGAYHPTPAE